MDNLILRAPVDIKIDDLSVGRTLGDVSVQRVRAEYAELRRQDSIHLFGLVKQGVIYEVLIPLAEHTAVNIARCFDVAISNSTPAFNSDAVQEIKVFLKAEDNTEITFAKCVQVGTDGPIYSYNNITVLQLRLWVILGVAGGGQGEPALVSIDNNNMPGQFQYWVEQRERASETPAYSRMVRYAAPFVDRYIHWECENMTIAEKNTLESIHASKQTQLVDFTGYHGEEFKVWFSQMDAPRERGGRYSTAGTMTVETEAEDES